ncbi:MAG TPA: anthranilate synthase component I, partial [Paraprevotella xylaniphila]|nr:anthranilate synthase component I [Paraprevotella xylaniphila]
MNTFHYSTACRQILGDLHTPVSTYLKVRDLYPQSALMESSDYHSHDNSRSFIALNPIASIDISHGTVTAQYPDGTQETREINGNYPVEQAFNYFLSHFTVTGENKEFCGLYGYTSFNAVRYFEHIEIKDCMQEKNDAPDILYILYKYVIAFDHFNNT